MLIILSSIKILESSFDKLISSDSTYYPPPKLSLGFSNISSSFEHEYKEITKKNKTKRNFFS